MRVGAFPAALGTTGLARLGSGGVGPSGRAPHPWPTVLSLVTWPPQCLLAVMPDPGHGARAHSLLKRAWMCIPALPLGNSWQSGNLKPQLPCLQNGDDDGFAGTELSQVLTARPPGLALGILQGQFPLTFGSQHLSIRPAPWG